MAQKKRIFVAAPQDLNSRTCHKTTKLRQTDTVYLVSDSVENETLPEFVQEFLDGKQVFIHTDDLAGFLRDRCSGKESIYFIGERMEPIYEEISNELLNYCEGVGKNQTFGVRNVRLKKLEQQTVDTLLLNNITDAIEEKGNDAFITDMDNAIPNDIITELDKIAEEGNKDIIKKRGSARQSHHSQREKTSDEKRKESKTNKKNELPESDSEIDLNALFEGGNAPDKKMSNAKAGLMAALIERIHRHAEAVLVQKISEDQYFQLMLIFMKSESLEEASESWQCLQPTIPLKITTGEFSALKSEAIYYGKVSDMLYGEDLWNY